MPLYAQWTQVVGARAWGMGQAAVAQRDAYALFNNVAGIGGSTEPIQAVAAYSSFYGLEGLGTFAAGVVAPLSDDLSFGGGVRYVGDALFNQLQAGLGVGHRINRVSLGLKVNYVQQAVTTPSWAMNRKALVMEMGGIAQLSSKVYWGAHISNFTQTRLGEGSFPTELRTGVQVHPSSSVVVAGEVVKDTARPMGFRAGLSYMPIPRLHLRTGIDSATQGGHFGVGILLQVVVVDIAIHTHPQLGWSQHFSLRFTTEQKNTTAKRSSPNGRVLYLAPEKP